MKRVSYLNTDYSEVVRPRILQMKRTQESFWIQTFPFQRSSVESKEVVSRIQHHVWSVSGSPRYSILIFDHLTSKENCLIRAPILGVLQKPLSALVFHYDEAASHSNFKPSEVAFLASSNPKFPNQPRVSKINVLVSPSISSPSNPYTPKSPA